MSPSPTPPPRRPLSVLVTGGAGFVGSHLAELLWREGHAVTVLDDLSTGDRANLAALEGRPRFGFTRGDAADAGTVRGLVACADRVFHVAGVVGVRLLAQDPVRAMTGNLRCTETVLAECARRCVPVLLTSSSEVYGEGPVPFRESEPVRPGRSEELRGGYACAKAMGEWLARAYAADRSLPIVVARLFNTVGPRQTGRYGMVLPRFAAQALAGGPITVYGDGAQRRCFAHVREVARALVELLETPAAHGGVFNVGSDTEVAILELAERVRRAADTGAAIERVPFDAVFPSGFSDPPRRVPCLRRLRATLGWTPATGIEDIVRDVLEHERAVGRGAGAAPLPADV